MEPISLQSLINLTQDDGSVLSPQGPWTLTDFKSYWPFLRKYQTSHQTFARSVTTRLLHGTWAQV